MVGRLQIVFVLVGWDCSHNFQRFLTVTVFSPRYNCVTRLVYINVLLYPLLIKMSTIFIS